MKYTKIYTSGQITAVVYETENEKKQNEIANQIMKEDQEVEQVIFVLNNAENTTLLSMMGGELSINGLLAGGIFALSQNNKKSTTLKLAELNEQFKFFLKNNTASLELNLKSMLKKIQKNLVVLNGISYLLINQIPKDKKITSAQKKLLFKILNGNPASGLIFYQDDKIMPLVYVAKTDSYYWENACGSGSIAFSLVSGVQNVRQPSSDPISIRQKNGKLSISVITKNSQEILKENQIMKPQTIQPLKGFRDFLPSEARERQWLKNKIIKVFELWGYDPLETPTLEPLELFAGQIGEDENLFFKFKDAGDRDVALRYDQTVPTCRLVGANYQQLAMPFRRYQIQPAFRAEKPQKGRYREFLQCDADIFGTTSPLADAEVIALSLDIYRQIGFKQVKVLINDRELLKDLPYEAIVAIDKLKKIGKDGVITEMVKKGIAPEKAEEYFTYVTNLQPNDTIKTILNYLEKQGFPRDWYEFDATIARSFSYSTGPIWEIQIPGFSTGSVLGGERFDKLVEKVSGNLIPATGFAIGFDRTLEAAREAGLVPKNPTATQILIANFDENYIDNSIEISQELRKNGINTEVYPAFDKLGKQFKYADKKRIPWVIIVGEDEIKNDAVMLKNMIDGSQQQLNLSKVIEILCNK